MAAGFPVGEVPFVDGDAAGRQDGRVRSDHAFLERRRRHHQLEGRSGRQRGGDGPREHRIILVLQQPPEVLGRYALGEKVVVEVRRAHQGQDLAGSGLQDHQAAAGLADGAELFLQDPFGLALQVEVDGQHQVMSGRAGLFGDHLFLPAQSVDLEGLFAVTAAQGPFVFLLQAGLADEIRRQVVRVGRGQLGLGRPSLETDDVRQGSDLAGREIFAPGADDQGRRRRAGRLDRQQHRLIVRQAVLEHHGRAAALVGVGDLGPEFVRGHVQDAGQPRHQLVQVSVRGQVGRFQGGRKMRHVAGQRFAAAVVKDASLGRRPDHARPVALGPPLVEVALEQLDLGQTRRHQEQAGGQYQEEQPQPAGADRQSHVAAAAARLGQFKGRGQVIDRIAPVGIGQLPQAGVRAGKRERLAEVGAVVLAVSGHGRRKGSGGAGSVRPGARPGAT